MSNTIAIVGRPNVGKSTLFNRLVGKRQAITDNKSGVTRDRHYGISEWIGYEMVVIDTGGYVADSNDIFEKEIQKQVLLALKEATVILFMVDCIEGLHPLDSELAKIIRLVDKPVVIAANKADSLEKSNSKYEFYALGLKGEIFSLVSTSGWGTGDLLDHIVTFCQKDVQSKDDDIPKIAILGRPNAGKSSYINLLLGEERNMVTEVAGTTRDAIDTRYKLYGKDFILIDTAGIRKKSKVKENLEFYSVMRALKTLQEADVCVLIVDAQRGFESQDMNIIYLANKNKKGIIILVNKWDLIEKSDKTHKQFKDEILNRLGRLNYISILFISVLTKQRVFKSIEEVKSIYDEKKKKIPTSKLNDVLLDIIEKTPPPSWKGKYVKIKYITQLPLKSPTFVFFCNLPQYIKVDYQRFLENRIRENFGFQGVAIKLLFRKK